MKRAGSSWKTDSGAHVIKLRALALSDRWDDAMHLVFKPLRKAADVRLDQDQSQTR